ncbi:putative HNHc nuclease [Candidatus Clostridium radicumherbarum]|uniref:HNHc nuclease n=1 Tax=Candidatus Clostridium radicumherbarum TaxID=3381662 RepID=A0ABW8TNE9_9CLOT
MATCKDYRNKRTEEVLRYSTNGSLQGELKLDDGRLISAEQRKKVFACVKDISLYTGYEAEYIRDLLQF